MPRKYGGFYKGKFKTEDSEIDKKLYVADFKENVHGQSYFSKVSLILSETEIASIAAGMKVLE